MQSNGLTRVENFNIEKRHLVSGIYGSGTKDAFIDTDTRKCNVRQILYRSFKKKGYRVIFCSTDSQYNLFSYDQEDLAYFYTLPKSSAPAAKRYVAPINSPFGNSRRTRQTKAAAEDGNTKEKYAQIQTVNFDEDTERRTFYRVRATIDIFDMIVGHTLYHPKDKIAFIFPNAYSDIFPDVERIQTSLENLIMDYDTENTQIKIVAIYQTNNVNELFNGNTLFRSDFFKKILIGAENNEEIDTTRMELYYLGGPGPEEFFNLLNYKDLNDGFSIPIDEDIEQLSIIMSQRTDVNSKNDTGKNISCERIGYYINMDNDTLTEEINKLNKKDAEKELEERVGLENIKEQFHKYIQNYETWKKHPGNTPRFRPHMVFMGNPGTGKTTVARLFANILREKGLLSRGHLIEATVGDMEGQYVGETRIKTQALCDRARGGVLFIDEAYGLMSGKSSHNSVDYGKEAIEVLIQFMENSSDSLVILAGYKAQMEDLIKNGNQGFMRRFNGESSFFHFKDYTPDELYKIFRMQLKDITTEPDFDTTIQRLISSMYNHRNARWGNAGEMEILASNIYNNYVNNNKSTITSDDIPKEKLRLISSNATAINNIMQEIESMIGLAKVKEGLRELLHSSFGSRRSAELRGISTIEKEDLNFVFMGNPGTGKTTVARMMGRILHEAGILESNDVVQLKIGDIAHSEVGGTAKAIDKLFYDNSGKVIFIDEAYELARQGREAITPITDNLFDERFRGNQAFILAGYTQEMGHLISENPGLKSRFTHYWLFEDYNNEELWEIFRKNVEAQGMELLDVNACHELALDWFEETRRTTNPQEFGNARLCGKNGLLGKVMSSYGKRLCDNMEINDKEYASRYIPSDFPNYSTYTTSMSPKGMVEEINTPTTVSNDIRHIHIDCSAEEPMQNVSIPEDFGLAVGLLSGNKGMGTAFIVSKKNRYILTASHVVENDSNFTFHMHRGEYSSQATLVWHNAHIDMAILQVDSLPDDTKYFIIDDEKDKNPQVLEEIIHCGYIKGIQLSKNFNTYQSTISNYDPNKEIGQRKFDSILSNINAAEGCSGGPVFRKSDMKIIGLLQGGFVEGETRIITDIHQLFKQEDLTLKTK